MEFFLIVFAVIFINIVFAAMKSAGKDGSGEQPSIPPWKRGSGDRPAAGTGQSRDSMEQARDFVEQIKRRNARNLDGGREPERPDVALQEEDWRLAEADAAPDLREDSYDEEPGRSGRTFDGEPYGAGDPPPMRETPSIDPYFGRPSYAQLLAENEALERNIAAMGAEINFLRNRVDELNTQISGLKTAGKVPAVKPVGEVGRFVMPRGGADLRRAFIIKEVLSGPISDRECI